MAKDPVVQGALSSLGSLTESTPDQGGTGLNMDALKDMEKSIKGYISNMKKSKGEPPVTSNTYERSNQKTTSGQTPSLESLGTKTVPFGGETRYEDPHPGVDIANKIGTEVPSFTPGKVVDVKRNAGPDSEGFGKTVKVKDPRGSTVRYSHFNRVHVEPGQKVSPGMTLGEMGNTGSTYSTTGGSGSHLDLRIKNAYDKYINPNEYL